MIDKEIFKHLAEGTVLYKVYPRGDVNEQKKGNGWFEHVGEDPRNFSLTIKEAYMDKIQGLSSDIKNNKAHNKHLRKLIRNLRKLKRGATQS